MNFTLLRVLVILFAFLFTACKSDAPSKKQPQKNPSTPAPIEVKKEEATPTPPPVKEEEAPSLDTINYANAIDFLIAYGEKNKETKVKIETKYGTIMLKLYEDVPLHRASFIFLTKMGYFDTTCFYRVAPDFVAQAGNSELKKTSEMRNRFQNYTIPPEFRSNRKHKYGAIGAARQYEENISKKSSPFEFYIVTKKRGANYLDNDHTVFGEVTSGMSVAEKISRLKSGSDEWPYEDVFLKATVVE